MSRGETEGSSDPGGDPAGAGRGGLFFRFWGPCLSLAGIRIFPAGATRDLSDSTWGLLPSPPPACTHHPHHEIEFTADSNTFQSIYCKITFQ